MKAVHIIGDQEAEKEAGVGVGIPFKRPLFDGLVPHTLKVPQPLEVLPSMGGLSGPALLGQQHWFRATALEP